VLHGHRPALRPRRPLPHELVQLAKQFYDAAIHATQQQQQQQPAPGAACRPPAPAGPALHAACTSASFQPDAAIVNYYYEGDTLGGHRDDAESDMLKPIVTLSLGCDSVFLMGGLTKEVAPTALRLRSGDVLVMGGQARSCYHGLPRVLTDRPLPDEVLAAAQALVPWEAGGQLPAVVQHMQACRVNISIRAID
jgi:alkylated DNA repair dioxygenase AlkB